MALRCEHVFLFYFFSSSCLNEALSSTVYLVSSVNTADAHTHTHTRTHTHTQNPPQVPLTFGHKPSDRVQRRNGGVFSPTPYEHHTVSRTSHSLKNITHSLKISYNTKKKRRRAWKRLPKRPRQGDREEEDRPRVQVLATP